MHEPKNYDHLIGLEGFSDTLLKNHFTLYQGYVTNTNKLNDSLKAMLEGEKAGTPEYNELKRRYGWEYNGMKLHELYFENMTTADTLMDANSPLAQKIVAEFGSIDAWAKDFKATGAMRGIGWTILYHDKESDRLTNTWINEHDGGHLTGATPLLVMDVFEHAFMLDYGLKRADYIESFWNAINWEIVENRLS